MVTSLEQLFKTYQVEATKAEQMKRVCKPSQATHTNIYLTQSLNPFRVNFDVNLEGYILQHRFSTSFDIVKSTNKRSTIFTRSGDLNVGDGKSNGTIIGILFFDEPSYQHAKSNYDKFWEWKLNRNSSRSALEEQFGYDTKHAMHLVRLLRMGHEALTEGVIRVRRPDAQELLSIRAGAWTYEQVVEYAEHMNAEVDKALKTSQLRKDVDLIQVTKLIMDVQNSVW
jgi:hypothetical protein